MKTPGIWIGWIGLIGLCWSISLQAASFDCSAKLSTVESMICADAQISALDDTLSGHYQQLISALPSQDRQTLKRVQREWLQQRNACDSRSCLLEHYQRRIDQLAQGLLTARYQGKAMRVNDIFLQNYDQANAINVRFSVPVDADQSWQDYFVVLHEGKPVSADDWLLADNGLKAVLPFVAAESQYQVMVNKGLKGINGQTLSSKQVEVLKTQAVQPFASFASQGYVLSPQLKMSLPISTLNMDEVDLDVFHIPPTQLKQWGHLAQKS